MHIYVTYSYEPSSTYLAFASACVINPSSKNRPVFGMINFNAGYLTSLNFQSNLLFENAFEITIHEITHVLGFSSFLY